MKLNAKRIERKTKFLKVNSYDCVDSTNNIAKAMALDDCDEGITVVATKQTAGRGRLGRSFLSKRGGVYFSIILHPKKQEKETLFITVAAAVAAARAIESVSGKKCDIKWVNDIYINGKKVCGILAEGSNDYVVLGVGINLFAPKGDFPKNLPLAGSVFSKKCNILRKNVKKEQIIAEFANTFFSFYQNLSQKEFITEYQNRSFLTGKEITYTKNGENHKATVICIDNDANLVVKSGELEQKLSYGEIQIVGMEQQAV